MHLGSILTLDGRKKNKDIENEIDKARAAFIKLTNIDTSTCRKRQIG